MKLMGVFALGGAALFLNACATPSDETAQAVRQQAATLFGSVKPVTPAEVVTPMAVLGRALYWDTRLSLDGKTACASCHARADWSSDSRVLSVNAKGEKTTLHSQPMFMAQEQFALRWYGDRKDGVHQAERSITGSMGLAKATDITPLLRQHGYTPWFEQAFSGEAEMATPTQYARALQAYQLTLRTPAAFDRFLNGDTAAFDAQALRGLQTFIATGCAACHAGPLLGGTSVQKFGVVKDYWLATGSTRIDAGRYNVTKNEADRYVYRVPMLRNIEKTAPYFHDGSVATLEAAVRVMGEVQLGRQISDGDLADIVAFLRSLTGELPEHYAAPARLPAATAAGTTVRTAAGAP